MATATGLKAKRSGSVNEISDALVVNGRKSAKLAQSSKHDGSGAGVVVRAFPTKAAPGAYHPSENEPYMSPAQLAYFKSKLQDWRSRLLLSAEGAKQAISEPDAEVGDEADSANATVQRSMDAHTQDHSTRVVAAIDAAVRRIATGDYGYCEETGEEIGLRRLEANPVARLSIEAQERAERMAGTVAGSTIGGII